MDRWQQHPIPWERIYKLAKASTPQHPLTNQYAYLHFLCCHRNLNPHRGRIEILLYFFDRKIHFWHS